MVEGTARGGELRQRERGAGRLARRSAPTARPVDAARAVDLGAQLPIIVRGIYYEGWRMGKTPQKVRSQDEFLEGVSAKSAPHPIGAEQATRDVFALLAVTLDRGEILDVISQLPAGVKDLWPQGARDQARRARRSNECVRDRPVTPDPPGNT